MDWEKAINIGVLCAAFSAFIIRWSWEYGMKCSRKLWKDNQQESIVKIILFALGTTLTEFIVGAVAYILS